MSPDAFYLVFIVMFTILAFVIGSMVALSIMSSKVEPGEEAE